LSNSDKNVKKKFENTNFLQKMEMEPTKARFSRHFFGKGFLTATGRQNGIGILGVGGDLGNPSTVAQKGAAQL
jgi:hypothetical protein